MEYSEIKTEKNTKEYVTLVYGTYIPPIVDSSSALDAVLDFAL